MENDMETRTMAVSRSNVYLSHLHLREIPSTDA